MLLKLFLIKSNVCILFSRLNVVSFQFAASTHGPLDAISLASEDLDAASRAEVDPDSIFQSASSRQKQDLACTQINQISTSSESRARAASTLDLSRSSEKASDLFPPCSSNLVGPNKISGDLFQTSDLGTSDFSSSELWPSASPSPFDYSQRYR